MLETKCLCCNGLACHVTHTATLRAWQQSCSNQTAGQCHSRECFNDFLNNAQDTVHVADPDPEPQRPIMQWEIAMGLWPGPQGSRACSKKLPRSRPSLCGFLLQQQNRYHMNLVTNNLHASDIVSSLPAWRHTDLPCKGSYRVL